MTEFEAEIQAALGRVFAARTVADMQGVFLQEPELFSSEADALLAKLEQTARDEGDADASGLLAQLREVLRSDTPDFSAPDVPGAHAAAELIHSLIAAAPDDPVPASALSFVFFAVLDGLRDHARQHKLDAMIDNLDVLHSRIEAAGGRQSSGAAVAPSILATIEEWIDLSTWIDSHYILASHSELLSDDTLAILALLAAGARTRSAPQDAEVLEQHIRILESVRAGNFDDTYVKLMQGERKRSSR